MKALKYRPEEVIVNSVSATDTFMKLALANSDAATVNGSISTAYLMDPQDPKYANNKYMKLYRAQMAKYSPQSDPNNGLFFYGFAKAWDVAKVLGLSGKTPSRAKLMSAVRHMNWTNPFMIPGVKEKTTGKRSVPALAGQADQVPGRPLERVRLADQRARRHVSRLYRSTRRAGKPVSIAHSEGPGRPNRVAVWLLYDVKALSPVRARPMISFWIWLVPS